MKVLIAEGATPAGWSRFHRDANCPGLRKGEVTHGAEYVARDLDELPDTVKPCNFECCFPGHETAADTKAKVLDPSPERPVTGIRIGQEVEIRDVGSVETKRLRIVRGGANQAIGELSVDTPIARGLLGHEEGEVVDLALPNKVRRVEIVKVI